jgi:hypothetical protein
MIGMLFKDSCETHKDNQIVSGNEDSTECKGMDRGVDGDPHTPPQNVVMPMEESQWICGGEQEEIKTQFAQMKGCFWNIRGLNHPGRKCVLTNLIRQNFLDFVGIVETKKETFLQGFLDSLSGPSQFSWHSLPATRTAWGLLLGIKDDFGISSNITFLEFSLSCVVQNKKAGFVWKLVMVYEELLMMIENLIL